MPQPIKLTYAEVVEKGRKAFLAGELSAQGPTPACAYRDMSGRPCVIGAALDEDVAGRFDRLEDSGVLDLIADGLLAVEGSERALQDLQSAHDRWVLARGDDERAKVNETRLRKLLNIEEAA